MSLLKDVRRFSIIRELRQVHGLLFLAPIDGIYGLVKASAINSAINFVAFYAAVLIK